ncbi:hypothetical protein EI555_018275, partial [Monodon monoceros]
AGSQRSATCWASQVGAGQPDSPSQALPPGQSGATPYQPQRLARAGRQEVEKTSGEHMLSMSVGLCARHRKGRLGMWYTSRLVRKEGVYGCLFSPQDPQAQAAYLAIPALPKARTSRSCGETSAVLKDRKRGTENSTGKGWVMGFVRLIEDRGLAAMVMGREEVCSRVASASLSVHLRAGRQPHGSVQGTGLEAWGRVAGLRSAPWRREEARAKPPRCPAPGPAPLCPRKWGSSASSHGTGDSLPGEGAGASRGRSHFSADSFVPCVTTRASESLTQSRARIASPPTTHPERAEKLQDCRGTASAL